VGLSYIPLEKEIKMDIGQALYTARKDYTKMNQSELAKRLGLSQTYLSQIENGWKEPSMTVLNQYEKVCGIPLSVILWFGLNEDMVDKKKQRLYRELKPVIDNLINQVFK